MGEAISNTAPCRDGRTSPVPSSRFSGRPAEQNARHWRAHPGYRGNDWMNRLAAVLTLTCLEAFRSIRRNKLRSGLAAVAITIGIAAVVCVLAIGRAGSQRAEEQLRNLGDNFVWVEAGSRAPSGVRTGTHGTTRLTLEDAEAILRDVPLMKRVTPNVDGNAQVIFGNRN